MIIESIIVAAGKGRRFGSKKQFEKLKRGIVLDYSVNVFKDFGGVVVVCDRSDVNFVLGRYQGIKVVEGGKERMNSVYNGLNSIEKCDIVLIHDAARPLVDHNMVSKLIDEVDKYEAAILAIPAFETLKVVEKGFIKRTLDRDRIVISQTPQGFNFGKLKKAMDEIIGNDKRVYTDEASIWEEFYGEVKVVEGKRKNIKITTKEDLELVKCLLE